MLTLTETASTVVKTIVAQTPGLDDGGLRINTDQPGGTEFAVSVAPAPEDSDAVVEAEGAKVFLGQFAALALDDKVLDAQVGEDGTVRFAIGDQA
ncbi:iron-sulfur cluster assembly accessory protein [Agromyces sp. SYSU T00194]|uniref:iron-sulfur cluster assembly accessory protein n=1 Tax=Agromyces chitinivorans TaxID=3158560 RepID=UPI003398707B